MAEFTITEVCAATGGTLCNSANQQQFRGICTDTRTVRPGDLFVALRGERFDGHDFIAQAIKQGATGVLIDRTDRDVTVEGAVILVGDTLQALQKLATFHRRRFTIPIIAITGSNGKTTTKDITAAVLASRFRVLKTEGNFNNEIGLPLTLLKLTDAHEVAVIEMGMRDLGEIDELTRIGEPTAGIITNVGETHIELLGSLGNIAKAKGELVEAIGEAGFVVLNGDDPYVREMRHKAKGKVICYGIEPKCHVRATQIRTEGLATSLVCCCFGKEFPVVLPAIGRHNVYNALAAIAAGWELGLTIEEIQAGLLAFQPSSMRQHIEKIGEYIVINDAYNASPLSMASALDTLQQVAQGRAVAVLGDMLELGDIATMAHRRIGQTAAASGVELVITVGPLARHIAEAASEAGVPKAVACDDHEQAWQQLSHLLKPGDTILVKGSRGMKMEQIVKMFG